MNPVYMLHPGLIFGMGMGWLVLLGVSFFDLLVSRRGWCGRLCPVGALYSLLASHAPLRVRADRRAECNSVGAPRDGEAGYQPDSHPRRGMSRQALL